MITLEKTESRRRKVCKVNGETTRGWVRRLRRLQFNFTQGRMLGRMGRIGDAWDDGKS